MHRCSFVFVSVVLSFFAIASSACAEGQGTGTATVADVKTTPKSIDDLTNAEVAAIAQDCEQKYRTIFGFDPPIYHRLRMGSYLGDLKMRRTHAEWVAFAVDQFMRDTSKESTISEFEKEVTANKLMIAVEALEIPYTQENLKALLNKLKTKNVAVTKQGLIDMVIADALLNQKNSGAGTDSLADVKTTPKSIDDLTNGEVAAIAQDCEQKYRTIFGFDPPIYHRLRMGSYLGDLKMRRTHAEWVAFAVDQFMRDTSKESTISEFEKEVTANKLMIAVEALEIPYTQENLKALLNKLKTKNVAVTKQGLIDMVIADALLTQMKTLAAQTAVVGASHAAQTTQASQVPSQPPTRSPLNMIAIEGNYRFEPYANDWHQGTLKAIGDFRVKWTNQAGVSWDLTVDLSSGVLRKDDGSPYQNEVNGKEFVLARNALGDVSGFQFNGAFYRKTQ